MTSHNELRMDIGLFSCCDEVGLSIKACFCPCLVAVENKAMVDGRACETWDCCACPNPCLDFFSRQQIRAYFQHPGESFTDCCLTCFCNCCHLVQTHRFLQDPKTIQRLQSVNENPIQASSTKPNAAPVHLSKEPAAQQPVQYSAPAAAPVVYAAPVAQPVVYAAPPAYGYPAAPAYPAAYPAAPAYPPPYGQQY
eukprot:gnl/Hemi2/636_TR226_c0_g1_i1.p1 gnl/Hemi2/636_TR226_c0_g1~~gnl/Hemi2/636_TR226_c0_g1_i1.p1  ORF type:complete len:195 (-),score=38.78 gnl/Hemi2/636_TR226_c0_g1_i1:142-726(-)